MPMMTSYHLPDFVRDLTAAVERLDSDQERVEAAEGLLARLLTITVHVYGKQLRQFRIFEPTGVAGVYSTRLQVVGYTAPAQG